MEEEKMTNLHELLSNRNWHTLRALARAHGVRFDNRCTKAQAVDKAVKLLTDPATVRRALAALPDDAREALQTLVANDGLMPTHRFLASFGPIRPYRPWRAESPRAPWRNPTSPAERLWFLGFVFRCAGPGGDVVVIPDELRPLVPASPLVMSDHPSGPPSPVPDPVLDLAHLLALLQTEDVRPLAGRWLAPRHLRDLDTSLASPDPAAPTARSELQTGYIRFLHYLAEAGGLVALTAGLLKPTPAAWGWLDLPQDRRWRLLWAGWQADLDRPPRAQALWERFRLPGERAFALTLFDTLRTLPATRWISPVALADRLRSRCVGAGALPREGDVLALAQALLAGPLAWAGLAHADRGGNAALTALGDWLLDRAAEPPAPPPTRPAAARCPDDEHLLIALPAPPAHPPLRPLVDLPLEPDDRLTRRLTRERFVATLSHGIARAHVVQNLLDLTGGPLPAAILERLEAWESEARRLTLRRLAVMTAADPQLLAQLSTQRAVRPHLRETLSPHHVAVDPSGVERLLHALHRRGHTPLVEPGVISPSETSTRPDAGAAAHLWLALCTYLELADLVELPAVPPAALLDSLGQMLDADRLAALAVQVEEASRRLRDALDGYTPFPAPLADVDHTAVLAVVEQALEETCPIEIVYHTAGRGERTARVIEPLRLEERGGATYLVAHCRLRQAERVFRLDRIERAHPYTMR
jgi:hypothetical protein